MSLLALLASHVSHAGDDSLGDFEDAIERREQREDEEERPASGGGGDTSSGDALGAAIGSALIVAADASSEHWADRRKGAPAAALVRIASAYQRLASSDVDGLTTRAAGSRHIAGHRSRWAHGGGFSIGLYPNECLGVEADLRWAEVSDRTSGDYRVGALLRIPRFPYLALRGGYRVIQYQNETLDGPEVGLVGTW